MGRQIEIHYAYRRDGIDVMFTAPVTTLSLTVTQARSMIRAMTEAIGCCLADQRNSDLGLVGSKEKH